MKSNNYKRKPNTKTKDERSVTSKTNNAVRKDSARSKNFKDSEIKASTDNDIKWYSKNPNLLQAAGQISFGQKCGAQLGFEKTPTIPGVFNIYWYPVYNNAGIKVAQDNIYSYVVHANSRNTSYEPADLMMYIAGADSVYSAIASLIRVYGLMREYDGMNLYTPNAILHGCGLNYDDLLSNYHKMWSDINYLIAQSHTIWVPSNLPVLARHFWLNTNVYRDGGSPKSQYYQFIMTDVYKFKPTGSEAGGTLEPTAWMRRDATTTWSTLVATVQNMINALRDADIGTMSGDILKAYGQENLYMINEIPIDYRVQPVENEEVLTQIHNCNSLYFTAPSIKQTNGYIQSETYKTTAPNEAMFAVDNGLLDFFKNDNPSAEEVMIATRLSVRGNIVSSVTADTTQYLFSYEAFGTEMVSYFSIVSLDKTGSFSDTYLNTSNDATWVSYEVLAKYSMFDWAPLIYVTSMTADNQNINVLAVIGDVENCITLTSNTLRRLHDCAILSEFDVPAM